MTGSFSRQNVCEVHSAYSAIIKQIVAPLTSDWMIHVTKATIML